MSRSTCKIIFLDRDGIINKDVGYLYQVQKFEFINGIFKSCKHFKTLGYGIIIITNQSGISRGYYQEKDFHTLTQWMLRQFKNKGVNILDVFFCPHGPESTCICRKPKPGMLLEARDKFNIDMENSWMIGDKESDINAANAAGINNTILVKSGHIVDETNSKAKFVSKSIKDSIQIIK